MVSVYSLETCDRVKWFNALWLRRGEGREERGEREGGQGRECGQGMSLVTHFLLKESAHPG